MSAGMYVWKNDSGWCGLGWTERGLLKTCFGCRTRSAARESVCACCPACDDARTLPEWVARTVERLDGYFRGERVEFDAPLDTGSATGFRIRAWDAARRIPFGETRSYGRLAEMAGNRAAVRAAGGAMAANPYPVIVPCHRVVRADGKPGGYSAGGAEVKKILLALEAGENPDLSRIAGA
ncbi:MAG TPA: methylated-DNA--[protein]-cysteine S-methyltransferase [bacterium]|nr:methylated-DNA--[protein]-cysteine S-methyltransferase [bacterium]